MSFRHFTLGRISCAIIALAAVSLVGRMAFAAEPSTDPGKPAEMQRAATDDRTPDGGKQPVRSADVAPEKSPQTTPSRLEGPTSSNGIRLYRYGRATQIYGVH